MNLILVVLVEPTLKLGKLLLVPLRRKILRFLFVSKSCVKEFRSEKS